jgi:hypothetical protein
MGQYWKILDIDRRERLRNKNGLKLWEIVNSDTAQQLVQLLARPTLFQCSELLVQDGADANHPTTARTGITGTTGNFAKLPNELLNIFSGFLTDFDAICLGLTCRAMWMSMQARLQEALIADAAPWSGHRIITLGDYADAHPPGMLTEAEEIELRRNCFEDEEARTLPREALYRDASENYAEAQRKDIRICAETFLDPTDAKLLRVLVGPFYDFVNDKDGYVLRNLSKHEYVRADALVNLCGSEAKSQQPFIQPVGFGELVAPAYTMDR